VFVVSQIYCLAQHFIGELFLKSGPALEKYSFNPGLDKTVTLVYKSIERYIEFEQC